MNKYFAMIIMVIDLYFLAPTQHKLHCTIFSYPIGQIFCLVLRINLTKDLHKKETIC